MKADPSTHGKGKCKLCLKEFTYPKSVFKKSKTGKKLFCCMEHASQFRYGNNIGELGKEIKLNIKDVCAGCGNRFENSKEHYRINGNFCDKCTI